jgi:hypothetical protein
MIRYAQRRHLPLLNDSEAASSKRCTRSRFTLHGLLLTLTAVSLGCAGTASSSRSSGEEQETGIIVSSSVAPIRTDSLEYTPQGTPPRPQYIVIRATFTNFSSDTVYLGWCRAHSLPSYALEEYSAGTWRDPPGPYGLTCLHERVPPLVLAPNESHTAVIELGWFAGTGPPSHAHRDDLKLPGRTLRIVYTEAYRRPWTGGERPEPDAKLPRELRVSNAFRVLGEKAR